MARRLAVNGVLGLIDMLDREGFARCPGALTTVVSALNGPSRIAQRAPDLESSTG
jgi:hypothetical protein